MELGFEINPIKFYPYPSTVVRRVLIDDNYRKHENLKLLKEELLHLFQAKDDNKIVFEVELNGTRLFIGFKDGIFALGLGVNTGY